MDETAWLTSTEPAWMLNAMREKSGHRPFRLFAVACCRRLEPLLIDARSRNALDAAERWAEQPIVDGAALGEAYQLAQEALGQRNRGYHSPALAERILGEAQTIAGDAAASCAYPGTEPPREADWVSGWAGASAASYRASLAQKRWARARGAAGRPAARSERKLQCLQLHCIFGNPFRPLPSVSREWLTWNQGTVAKLARSIYRERRFEGMPVLADALEESGCDSADILSHCRQPGTPHVRGCWVLDLLLYGWRGGVR